MNRTLKQQQIESFKTSLLLERERLHVSEVETVHSDNDRLDIKAELPSNFDESSGPVVIETDIALEDHILRSIADINFALDRIESGAYGSCIDCSCDIPLARLQAFPAAARCLNCKTKLEESLK